MTLRHLFLKILSHLENHQMADFGPLNAKLDEIKALILAQQNTPAPVDDQPAVDSAATEADSIIALLKPAPAPSPAPETPAPDAPAA